MKPKYRRRSGSLADLLTEGQRLDLMRGWTFFGDGFDNDEASFRAAWSLHEDNLTEEFRHEHRNRDSVRPFAWWITEGIERPIIRPGVTKSYEAKIRSWNSRFGVLHSNLVNELGQPFQEPQIDFLQRMNLLTDEERDWLATNPK